MMLHIRRNMLMMRMRRLQCRIVGMRLRIVPKKLFRAMPDFIAVPINNSRGAMKDQAFARHRPLESSQ